MPPALTAKAEIPGMPGVRFVGGSEMTDFVTMAVDALRREDAYRASQGQTGPLPPAVYLAISGGGDNGAFAAGLLNAGGRPNPEVPGEGDAGSMDFFMAEVPYQ